MYPKLRNLPRVGAIVELGRDERQIGLTKNHMLAPIPFAAILYARGCWAIFPTGCAASLPEASQIILKFPGQFPPPDNFLTAHGLSALRTPESLASIAYKLVWTSWRSDEVKVGKNRVAEKLCRSAQFELTLKVVSGAWSIRWYSLGDQSRTSVLP